MPPRTKSATPAKADKSNAAAVAAANAANLVHSLSAERQEAFASLDPTVNEIVPASALKNLKNYQYATIDNSIMQKYLGIGKWWDFAVSFVPWYIAPNMLTLVACLFSMSYPLLIIYLENHLPEGEYLPKWVWLFSAFALFAYQTLDSIDGKHARRTGAKGPLGEMFDHGCDALFTPFMLYASCRCLDLSHSQTYLFSLVSSFTLYATIFEQFLSGALILPAVNGPTEGVIISVGVNLLTFFLGGSQFWATRLASPIIAPLPKTLVAACTINGHAYLDSEILVASSYSDIMFVVSIVMALATAISTVRHAYFRLSGGINNKAAICSLATHVFVLLVWALLAFVKPAVAYGNSRAFSILFGIYFAFAASDLTVHRLVQLPARLSKKMLFLCLAFPVAKLVTTCRNAQHEAPAAAGAPCSFNQCLPSALAIVMVGCYVFYLISVFTQFARGLGVNVVTLTAAQLKVSEGEAIKRSRQQ